MSSQTQREKEQFLNQLQSSASYRDTDFSISSSHENSSNFFASLESDSESFIRLKQLFLNEKFSPELLPFETRIVDNIKEQIKKRKEIISETQLALSTQTSEDSLSASNLVNFYQLELDRTIYLLRNYLRIRLRKIEALVKHIYIKQDDYLYILSTEEKAYAKKYYEIQQKVFEHNVLKYLNEKREEQDETEDDASVTKPDLSTYVFFRVTDDIGNVEMGTIKRQIQTFNKDDIFITSYQSVKEFLIDKKIELI